MRARTCSLALGAAVTLAAFAPWTSPRSHAQGIQAVADPVLVGAGDIADCSTTTDGATAALLDLIDGTIFTTGDNAYPLGRAVDFANCYAPTWGRHRTRTRPSPGNHDYYASPDAAPYFAYFGAYAGPGGAGYYSYNLGAWHIVSLNSNVDAQAGSAQELWLRADLAANPTPCTLAYWHHPLFSSGRHGNDPTMRDVYQTLHEAGADVVVTGHDHDYEQFHRQNADGVADLSGMRQFVVGTGGTSLRPFAVIKPNSAVRESGAHGVLKLTLHPASYDWQFVPIAGQTFTDAGTRPCVGTAPPPIGGRGFGLGGAPAGEEMTWTTGTAQVAYAVIRFAGGTATLLPAPGDFLPASTTEFVDGATTAGQFTCYALLPLDTGSVIGQSDVLCMVPGSASATNAPANTRVRLEQGTLATLTWSAPAAQLGIVLWILRLDGSPPELLPVSAGAVRVMHETSGIPTCYLVLTTASGPVAGNSDVLCAIPGLSDLSAGTPSRTTIGQKVRVVERLVSQVSPTALRSLKRNWWGFGSHCGSDGCAN